MFKKEGISKKVCAIVCSMVMALSLFATGVNLDTIVAKADGVVTATITYTAQYDGSFKDVKVKVPVSSDTAENMGYDDDLAPGTGVSMLDVIVQMHKDIFPEYNQENKDDYFSIAMGDYGIQINNIFKKGGMNCGYYLNGSSPARLLYEPVKNGDVVDTWYNQNTYPDELDAYTLFKDVTFEDGYLSGKLFRQWGWPTQEGPVSNVELGFVNPDTLEIVPVSPYGATKTSADGSFEIEMPSMSGNYMLTVYDGVYDTTPLVRTLCIDYPASPKVITSTKSMDERRAIYAGAGRYLSDMNPNISYGDSKEGYLIGLGRAGYPVNGGLYSRYYDSVREYLVTHNNRFESVTECAKVVAALNAIGYDPTNIDGVNITDQLNEINDQMGVYGFAYVLIAIDTKGYGLSARDTYIAKILEAQLNNGAWGWNGTSADIDTTGIVLAALAPYYNSNDAVKEAVNRAIDYLSKVQCKDGAFASGMDENSNSTALVVLGLSELGIDASSDARFVKNGVSAVDALCSFSVGNEGFGWIDNVEVNDYATNQSYYALGSYFRHISGMKRLFDMTPDEGVSSTDGMVSIIDPFGVLPAQAFVTIQRITSGEVFDRVSALINAAFSKVLNLAVFEIDLFDTSNTQLHQLNGKVYAKVKSPFTLTDGYKFVAYRVDGDRLIACDVIIDGEYILIGTNHFSTFVIAEVPVNETPQNVTTLVSPPKTGDNVGLIIAILAVIAAGCLTVFIKYKKKD